MAADEDEKDWRLRVAPAAQDSGGVLHRLVRGVRRPDLAGEISRIAPHDVVVTHDGSVLFAYAGDEGAITLVREAVEGVLANESGSADVTVSHWDVELDDWLRVYPELTEQERASQDEMRRTAEEIETRTIVGRAGVEVRREFVETMQRWAGELGLEFSVAENPHLLESQVAFTVQGPRGKVAEFARGLDAEGRAMIRTETTVMLSPL